jgi:hypothetical protein
MLKFKGTYSQYLRFLGTEQNVFKNSIINVSNCQDYIKDHFGFCNRYVNYNNYGIKLEFNKLKLNDWNGR